MMLITVKTYKGKVTLSTVLVLNVTFIVVALYTVQIGVFLKPVTPVHATVPIEGKVIPVAAGKVNNKEDVSTIFCVRVIVKE